MMIHDDGGDDGHENGDTDDGDGDADDDSAGAMTR